MCGRHGIATVPKGRQTECRPPEREALAPRLQLKDQHQGQRVTGKGQHTKRQEHIDTAGQAGQKRATLAGQTIASRQQRSEENSHHKPEKVTRTGPALEARPKHNSTQDDQSTCGKSDTEKRMADQLNKRQD